jgi:hypothetical protein
MAQEIAKKAVVRTNCPSQNQCRGLDKPQELLGIKPHNTTSKGLKAQGDGKQKCEFCPKLTPSIAPECVVQMWARHLTDCGSRGGDTPALKSFVCDCVKCTQYRKRNPKP